MSPPPITPKPTSGSTGMHMPPTTSSMRSTRNKHNVVTPNPKIRPSHAIKRAKATQTKASKKGEANTSRITRAAVIPPDIPERPEATFPPPVPPAPTFPPPIPPAPPLPPEEADQLPVSRLPPASGFPPKDVFPAYVPCPLPLTTPVCPSASGFPPLSGFPSVSACPYSTTALSAAVELLPLWLSKSSRRMFSATLAGFPRASITACSFSAPASSK